MMKEITKPSFREAFLFWLKLGFISFGGPAGQIAIMHEYLVDKKKWISDSRFLHALNYCMILPGPEAQQLATYIGWLLHGTRGGLTAGVLFVLPSVFILLLLSILYVTFGKIPWVYGLFSGLKPAVIAIIIMALFKIGKKSLLTYRHYLIALLSFCAIYFFKVEFPYIIFTAMAVGYLLVKFEGKNSVNSSIKINSDEGSFYLNHYTVLAGTGWNYKRFIKQIVIGIALWITPLLLFYFSTSQFKFWKDLTLFFTQTAFITFGGAYSVLKYVADVAVENFKWLTELQMIDGLALGETTPGPLIMILTFVGFMAGYHSFNHSLFHGSIGLFTTTFYTFLPCFLFIFVGAPLIEKTRENIFVKGILSFVTAAVVGVILDLSLYLSKAVVYPQGLSIENIHWLNLGWTIISLIALQKFKINMILWIGISALFGLLTYFLNQLF